MIYINISQLQAGELIKNSNHIFTFNNGYYGLNEVVFKGHGNKKEYLASVDKNNNLFIKKDLANDINIQICKIKNFGELESIERLENTHKDYLADYSNEVRKELTIRNIHQALRGLDNSLISNDKLNEVKEWLINQIDKRDTYISDLIDYLNDNGLSFIYKKESITLINGVVIHIYNIRKEREDKLN